MLLPWVDRQIGLIHRLAQAFAEQFVASYAESPSVDVLDMDYSED